VMTEHWAATSVSHSITSPTLLARADEVIE
jgi:hypothetical protein